MPLLLGAAASGAAVPPAWYNVKDYGAVGDNSHDDTTAIQTAVNTIKANVNAVSGSFGGNTLYFPPGFYKITSTLDLTLMPEVRILGGSGRGLWGRYSIDGNPPTNLNFTAGGSGVAVNMADSQGCVWDGVSIQANTSSFTGTLLNFDATASADVFGNRVQNCNFTNGTGGNGILLALDGNIEFSADNVNFGPCGSTSGAQIRMVKSGGAAGWSNANSFRSCSFSGNRAYSALNPGSQVSFIDCTFEFRGSDSGPAPVAANVSGVSGSDDVFFYGCGFWDVSSTTGSWVTSSVATDAWGFFGCRFEGSSGGPFFSFSAMNGLCVHACRFSAGGTPNVYDPAHNITNGSMLGCRVTGTVVDNHSSVFV